MNQNKVKHISTQELAFFYNLNVESLEDEYEQCCQTKRKTEWINLSLFIVSAIFIFGAFNDWWSGVNAFIVIFCLIFYSFYISSETMSVLSKFKNKATLIIFNYFELNFTCLETDTIDVSNLKSFGIYPDFDSKENTGSVFGRYKNRNIQMSSILLHKSNEDVREEIFRGLIIIVNLDNEFDGPIVVSTTKSFFNSDNEFEVHPLKTKSFVEYLYPLEKRTMLNLTFSFKTGSLLISIPAEFPDLSFYWQDLRYDFNNIMECMQLMFDVLDMVQFDLDPAIPIDDAC